MNRNFEPRNARRRITMIRLRALTSFVVWVALAWAAPTRADVVTDWNAIAVQTIVNSGPTHASAVSFLANPTVQVAVYDARVAFAGRFTPYRAPIPRASGPLP